MRLAVIPARGGSKRIPRKNIRPFAGKPMIRYAIDAARQSGVIDRIIVSTDDEEIAEIARQAGAETPFRRPPELADDFTPTVPVIAHAIEASRAAGLAPTEVCCIYPGVPLLRPADIAEAWRIVAMPGAPFVFPVTAFPSPIQRALRREIDGRVQPFHPEFVTTRTQDLPPAFYDAGQFYWGRADAWLEGIAIHANGRTIVLPEWRVVDIDTPEDWDRAELLYRALAQAPEKPAESAESAEAIRSTS